MTRRILIRFVAGIGLLLVASFVGYWYMMVDNIVPAVVARADTLWFGEVWEDDAFAHTVIITNNSTQRMRIKRFYASCGCINSRIEPFLIGPDASHNISLSVNLRQPANKWDNLDSGADSVEFVVDLFVEIDGLRTPVAVGQLSGRVRQHPLRIETQHVNFQGICVRGDEMPNADMLLFANMPLTGLVASCSDPDAGRVSIDHKILPLGESAKLRIWPSPQLAAGPFAFYVDLRSSIEDDSSLPITRILVTGKMATFFLIDPDVVILPAGKVGTAVQGTVLCRHLHGNRLLITNNAPLDGRVKVDQSMTDMVKGDAMVNIYYRYDRAGPVDFVVPLRVTDTATTECADVSIAVRGLAL